jgi:prepilin-type N-terminal cleavage/methylation domain-containing protein
MSIIKRKLSQKGFSLIELMVAIAILAMAIFGIFHAYSAGFMGMADARDRTVATNYAREAMEDIKNKDFDQIIPQSRNYIDGTKYEREVIVDSDVTNLKKVITKVYWEDRNSNPKMVETDMVIHFIETTAGTPTKIILYANPYNVLTQNPIDNPEIVNEKESKITAIIKDAKGNTVTTWNENIAFSLTGSGTLSSNTVTPDNFVNGKAIIIFTSGDSAEEVTITASSGSLTPDSVTIKITDPNTPVKINLTASPIFMTPGSVSIITATIVNAGGATVTEEIEQVEITFSVSVLGNLSTPTTKTTNIGETTITLTSSGTAGTITVTASSTGLEPGIINIYTGGLIYLSAYPINVPVNETSEITVTIKDMNGVPIKYNRDIYLNKDVLSTGSGNLPFPYPYTVEFNGESSSETVIFTASSVGEVKITANDSTPIILTPENYLILNVIPELNPDHIKVDAVPSSILVGGIEGNTSTITARVEDEYYTPITSYTHNITFETTAGSFYPDIVETSITLINGSDDYKNGVATVKLYSSNESETANISVTSDYYGKIISGNTRVGFYFAADHIDLIAIPQSVLTGGGSEGTCTIIATIKDGSIVVSGYNGTITFTIEEGYPNGVKFTSTNQSSINIFVVDGIATIDLQSKNWVGTAIISATASDGISEDITKSLIIPVVANKNLEIFLLYRKIDESVNTFDYMNYYNPEGVSQGSWNQADIIYGKFCVDSDNNLYILDLYGTQLLQKKSSSGETLLSSDEIGENSYSIDDSYAINIGPDGYVYFTQVTDMAGSPVYCIKKINPNTLLIEDVLYLPVGEIYYGFAVDSDGSIYIHNYTEQAIEKWNFIEGFTGLSLDLFSNYELSELTIAGDFIGGVGEVESIRKAFIIPKDFSSAETEFILNEITRPFYISGIDSDFLFSGLNINDEVVFGRYGTDDSLKWSLIITKEDEIPIGIPFSNCIIGAYPF